MIKGSLLNSTVRSRDLTPLLSHIFQVSFVGALVIAYNVSIARPEAVALPVANSSTRDSATRSEPQASPDPSAQKTLRPLKPGELVERSLVAGEVHAYKVTLAKGQFFQVVYIQKGFGISVKILGPGGQQIVQINGLSDMKPEEVFAVAEESGDYQIEVRALSKDTQGRYEIKVQELREATQIDKDRSAALKVSLEGHNLLEQRTAVSFTKAIEKYEEALKLWRGVGDRLWEATLLKYIGFTYSNLHEQKKALLFYEQSLPIWREMGDRREESMMLSNIGTSFSRLGDVQKAIECFNKALVGIRSLAGKGDAALLEAVILNNIGLEYNNLGDSARAVESFNQSLPAVRAAGNREAEVSLLNNIGLAYTRMGELNRSLEYYSQALALAKLREDRFMQARVLGNIGASYMALNEPQKALEYHRQALEIRRSIGDRGGELVTLNHVAIAIETMGEPERSLEYYKQALSLARAIEDRRNEALISANLGHVYCRLGDLRKGLEYFTEALPLRRAVSDRAGEGSTLSAIGWVYSQLGDSQKARDYINQSLALAQTLQDKNLEAVALNNLAGLHSRTGDIQKAIECYRQVLTLMPAVINSRDKASILLGIARFERDLGKLGEARGHIEMAIDIIESTRSKIVAPEARAFYLGTTQDHYKVYIDVLVRMHQSALSAGYDAKAFQVSEQARARSLVELLAESRADVKQGIGPGLIEKEKSVQARVSWTQNQLLQASSRPNADPDKLKAFENQLKKLDEEREQVELEIRQKSPRYADLKYPVTSDLKAIQQRLDDDTVLLEYSLDKDASFLFAVSKSAFQVFRLPSAPSMANQIKNVRQAVSSRPNRAALWDYLSDAHALYRALVEPAAKLLAGKKALIIVPDGDLWYLPFEVLLRSVNQRAQTDMQRLPYLIRDYSISYVPSATVLASLLADDKTKRKPAKQYLAYADPVYGEAEPEAESSIRSAMESTFGDAKLWNLRRLPYSRKEVEQIAGLFQPGQTRIFLAEQATETNVKTAGFLADYRYVHFALHGLLNENKPQYSGLILSLMMRGGKSENASSSGGPGQTRSGAEKVGDAEDGLLQSYEIFNLSLNADLVVLSACETGLGKEVKGEGLIGLTRAFLYAGASSVAVSLWKVEDESTAALMVPFYRLLKGGTSKAEALRRAQLELLGKKDFAHPYYWAGFVLMGHP